MLLCRLVGYRPYLVATLREHRDDYDETQGSSEGDGCLLEGASRNAAAAAVGAAAGVRGGAQETRGRRPASPFDPSPLDRHGLRFIQSGGQGEPALRSIAGRPSAEGWRATVPGEGSGRRGASSSLSRLDCTILQKPMLARPGARNASPGPRRSALLPAEESSGAAAAARREATPAEAGSASPLARTPRSRDARTPSPPSAAALLQRTAPPQMFSRSLPDSRFICLISEEEREDAFRYRQLKEWEVPHRGHTGTKEGARAGRRSCAGASAPPALEAAVPVSLPAPRPATPPATPPATTPPALPTTTTATTPAAPEFTPSARPSVRSPERPQSSHLANSFSTCMNITNTPFLIRNVSRGRRTGPCSGGGGRGSGRGGGALRRRAHVPSVANGNYRQNRQCVDGVEACATVGTKDPLPDRIGPQAAQVSLAPQARPRDAMLRCLQFLDSPEWEKNMQGLQLLVCLLKFHTMLPLTYEHSIAILLAKQVRNLRSQVSRAACMASSEFFSTLGKSVENDIEELAAALFHRSADTNKFLRADCNTALDSMVEAITPARALSIIISKGASHQNAIVRTSAARLLNQLVTRLGTDCIMSSPEMRDKIILNGANFLTEGSLDTRCHAKQIFRCLLKYEHFNEVLQDILPPSLLRNIRKSLQSLK